MKKIILLFCSILVSHSILFSQEECNDIIYTAGGNNLIFDCCIQEVRDGNIVYYTKTGDTLSIAAVAIEKHGQRFDLTNIPKPNPIQNLPPKDNHVAYKGHDLLYYQDTYDIANNQMGVGIALTSVGVLCEIAGIVILNNGQHPEQNWQTAGTILVAGGTVFETIGIPLWISGGIKRANNQRAINEIQRSSELSFGFTREGVGLILHL